MAIPASPFQAMPRGITPPPASAAPPPMAGPMPMGPSPIGVSSISPEMEQAQMQQQMMGSQELDLFQKVAMMMIDPQTKQINPLIAMFFAGMGAREALEKSGKFVSKPHRSNQELAALGYEAPNAGQANMPGPAQMAQQVRPPGVGVPPPPMGGM